MDKTKALYLPHDMAFPGEYVLNREKISDDEVSQLKGKLPADAIDFEMKEKEIDLDVGAVIVATGWKPYDANNLDNLGYGLYDNIITNVMMERLAAKAAPPVEKF